VQSVKFDLRLLGNAPKITIILTENEVGEEEGCSETFLDIKVYDDDDVNMKFLVFGVSCTLVSLGITPHLSHIIDVLLVPIDDFTNFDSSIAGTCLLASLEDGLNALLNIEV
jgi:hypothetical protein